MSVLQLVSIALGALILANLVAALPGRIAARTSTALTVESSAPIAQKLLPSF